MYPTGTQPAGARRSPPAIVRFHRRGLFVICFALSLTARGQFPRDRDYDYEPPKPGTYTLPVIKFAAEGVLLDTKNQAVTLSALTRGRITFLSFIYSRCAAPKGCPYATGVLDQLHELSKKDPELAKNMRLISISFDPEFDTPERLASYAENVRDEKVAVSGGFSLADHAPSLIQFSPPTIRRWIKDRTCQIHRDLFSIPCEFS